MSAKQMAILAATVVALVVIVTVLRVGLGGTGGPERKAPDGPLDSKTHLTFSKIEMPANPEDPRPPREEEMASEGHQDFWFVNENDVPVDTFLMKVSCNRCLSVKIGLAPEGWQAAQAAAAIALGPAGASGAVQVAKAPVPGADVAWQPLEAEDVKPGAHGVTVPAKAGGWVRMVWKGEEAGPQMLTADLRTTTTVSSAPNVKLQVGAIFVEPVRVLPTSKELAVETLLSSNDKPAVALFTVYSSTRASFTLEPESEQEQKARNPFVTCEKPVPLTPEQCRELEKQHMSAVKYAYKVAVTVRERLADGRQHDLGPFRTTVALKGDALADDLVLTVTGSVRGDVTVLTGGEGDASRDRVAFGAFPRGTGATKTVTVEAGPGVDVVLDAKPAFTEVQLTPDEAAPGKRKTWSLKVRIPPNAVSGPFGRSEDPGLGDTAIYLKANGRRVRVPVTGAAVQR
jgi:hypothetical protein